jgi:hypothetical protein
LRTTAARAAEAARCTRAVAIRQEQEAAQLQEELEATLEVVRRDLEELGHTTQGVGHDAPPVNIAALGARPPPQEVPAGDAARQRAAKIHGWVPDPRRQNVERRFVHGSVHDHDYNHDVAPPRVVKTIIRDSGSTQWPVLTKTNYAEWSSMMKVKLEARRLWTAVRLGSVSHQEDRRALEALCSAVPTKMVSALSGKATTKDAWDAIAAARVDSDRALKSALQKLREEWERLAFKPGEEVDNFALRLSSLRQRLEQYGDYKSTEERAITKFLRCSPKKYLQLKIAIQTMIDISTLTIEELTGRFKAVDDEEIVGKSFANGGKLYYATEHCQCLICRKKREPPDGRKRG